MELSRIKILFAGLVLQLLFTIAVPLPYNKYGRQCSDIGCLSTQVCVMAYDSCSLSQREGNDCGRYPTCKKKSDAGLAAGPSDNAQDVYSNNPIPSRTSSSGGSDDDVLASLGLNPDAPDNRNRPASRPNQDPYANPYPALPSKPQPAPAAPYRPPAPAPASPSGGNNYYGGGGGGSSSGGSGGNRRPGQFDGAGGNIVVPTQKPAAPSGGFFSGILGGIQNAVSNAVKQQVGTYINQRLGIGPAAGGAGGLLDANRFIDTKNFGSLFNEKKPSTGSSGQQSAAGHYPVTVDQRTSVYSSNAQPSGNRGGSSESSQYRPQSAAGTPVPYGWKLD